MNWLSSLWAWLWRWLRRAGGTSALLAAVVGLLIVVDAARSGWVLTPFDVPKNLVESGFTGKFVAERYQKEIDEIYSQIGKLADVEYPATTGRAAQRLTKGSGRDSPFTPNERPEIQLPVLGALWPFVAWAREQIGLPPRRTVGGSLIYEQQGPLRLRIKTEGFGKSNEGVFNGRIDAIDDLIRRAALGTVLWVTATEPTSDNLQILAAQRNRARELAEADEHEAAIAYIEAASANLPDDVENRAKSEFLNDWGNLLFGAGRVQESLDSACKCNV